MAHPGSVEPESFAEFDHLKRHLVPRPRILPVEQADRQEPKLLEGDPRLWHQLSLQENNKHSNQYLNTAQICKSSGILPRTTATMGGRGVVTHEPQAPALPRQVK